MSNRSTLDIIIAVKECQPVTEEELRLALLVMTSIAHFYRRDLSMLIDAVRDSKPSAGLRAKGAQKTIEEMFHAQKKDPVAWLGPENTPGTPEFQRLYGAAKALLARVEAKEPPT